MQKTTGWPSLGFDLPYLIAEWKSMLSTSTLVPDICAGITVALVALPLNLALAIAAGVEPGVGITTGIVACILASLFGGQRLAITGPAAAMAVILIEISQSYGIQAIWLVGLLAGLMQIAAGMAKFGKIISYIPMPVIVGFANAIGVLVLFNALDDFMGLPTKVAHAATEVAHANPIIPEFFLDIAALWQRCIVHHEVNWMAVTVGVVGLALALLTPKITKVVPGQLVAIVVATAAASMLGLDVPRIKDISSIPNMLPMPFVPALPWNELGALFPTVITVFLLGSIESLLSASVADGMSMSKKHHSNQELIGQGLANVVVPFFGGIPVTGVIARTAVNIRAGAKTRMSGIVHALTLTVLIFLCAGLAEQIPVAALASILILTGFRLIEWDAVREIWRGSRTEGYVVIATTAASVCIDLTAGVLVGLFLTCTLFIRQMSKVKVFAEEEQVDQDPSITRIPTCKFVKTYMVDGPLFFGAAERFVENIVIVDTVKVMILHMGAAKVMDMTGVETLLSIHRQLARNGGKLVLCELPSQPMQLMERTNALEKFGRDNVYSTYRAAVLSVNNELIESELCNHKKSPPKGAIIHTDCALRNALLDESSPVGRLMEMQLLVNNIPALDSKTGMEWLVPVTKPDNVPVLLKKTPIETLIKAQNFGLMEADLKENSLIIGMCIDYRKSMTIPKDWAYIIRREGANMDGAEFAIAFAASKGIRCMALIGHNRCGMSNTREHKQTFIEALVTDHGWTLEDATKFFDEHARSKEIGNEIDFVMEEAQRLGKLFPGMNVVPLLFRVEDDKLYLIHDWLVSKAPGDPFTRAYLEQQRDTGRHFVLPVQ